MSMHQGLDLSKFKVTARDSKTSTLRHAKGHEIKIAHSGLTPKMRDAIHALPVYKADGGEIDDAPVTEGVDPTPEDTVAAEGPPMEQGAPMSPVTEVPPVPAQPGPELSANPAAQGQEQAPRADGLPPKPDVMPQGGDVQVVGYKPPAAQELDAHDNQFGQDLALGHIKPETYRDLFEKKGKESTLGKVGTLFGLLLSGAGSGLAHQENAVLSMMNKEIDRDLDAQKASNSNAQNWVRLNQQHALQQVELPLMKAQADLAKAQASKAPAEIAEAEARVKQIRADALYKGSETAQNGMKLAALQELYGHADKLPPGPLKDQALSTLNTKVTPGVIATNSANNAKVAGTLAAREAEFSRRNQMLRVAGQGAAADNEQSRHIPGVGDASVPLSGADREQVTSSQQLIGSLQRLKEFSQKHGNSVDPKVVAEGKALAAQVQGDFRMATHGGVFKEGEQNFINQVVPGDPTAFAPGVRVIPKIDAVIHETTARNNAKLKALGVQPSGGAPETAVAQAAPQAATKMMNGVAYKRVQGGWAPVDQSKVAKKGK